MSTHMHIDYLPSRAPRPNPRQRAATTLDDPKQAQSATSTIPGRSLLNRNTSVSDLLAGLPTPPVYGGKSERERRRILAARKEAAA
jgi:hypothetical protein